MFNYCLKTCTGRTAGLAIATTGMIAAAALLGPRTAQAQTCGATMQPSLTPTDTVFAVGQSLTINLFFGPTAAAGGFRTIEKVTVRLDCENASGCDIGNPCTDDGNVLSYDGDATILTDCPGVAVTSNHPGGGFANEVIFTFTPALNLPTATQCTLSYGVTIASLSTDATPKNINGIASFSGTCVMGGLTGSACGTYEISVVAPDIEITKTACPSLVCSTGEDVTYSYEVTTGTGNASLVGSEVPPHAGVLPAQSQDGTWHRAIEVTDDTCGPGGPNTLLVLPGDTNANGLLEPGENWATGGDTNNNAELDENETWHYSCVAHLAATTTNTATAEGEFVNTQGSVLVEDDDSATVNVVTVNSTPGICSTTYTAKTSACAGETCVWTGPGFVDNSCQIVLGVTHLSGEYCVTVTCAGCDSTCDPGCEGSSPPYSATCCIEFEAPSNPVVDVTGSRVCAPEPLDEICATVTGGRAPYTVAWFHDGTIQGCQFAGNVLHVDENVPSGGQSCFTPSEPGTYVAVATDSNGCIGQDCGNSDSHPSKTIVAADVTVCSDQLPAELCATASGGTGPDYDITWYQPDGVTVIDQCLNWSVGDAPCCISASVEGIYVVKVIDSAECEDEDTATLTVNDTLTCSIEPASSCNPNQVLTASAFGECEGPFAFAWTKDGQPIAGGETGVLQATGVGTYCATVTCIESGCTSLEPCCATVNELPPCEFFCIDDACVGDNEEFCGPSGFDFYDWDVEGACEVAGPTNEQCVEIDFTAEGTCFIALTVSTEQGCSTTCEDSVNVYDNRTCEIDGPSKGCKGDSKIYCGPPNMEAYTWMTTGQCHVAGVNTNQCVVIQYEGNGDCEVKLHVNGQGGCSGECTIHVEVCECPVCIEIPPPSEDPVCGSSGNQLTATVLHISPDSEFQWDVIYGPCLITDGENELTVTYIIGADSETEVTCGFKFEVDGGSCFAPPSKCMIEVTCMPEPCGEGCSVTFWKNKSHAGQWPEPYIPSESCGVPTIFCNVFNCSTADAQSAFGGKTLLQVLQNKGNGLKSLGRQAVAALLNASHPDIEYAISHDHIIALVNAAIASGNASEIEDLRNDLLAFNVQGCPIGGQSFCVDLNLDGSVGNGDMQILLGNWGHAGAGDLDQDGIVGPTDLMILMANWGSY